MKKSSIVVLVLFLVIFQSAAFSQFANPADINEWRGKTVMVFAPHPDDELLPGGTLAKIAGNGNTVYVVTYTSGNKGSRDLDMTSEKLAQIRKLEEIKANKIINIPEENHIWLGYDDGMLEYVPAKELCEKVCRLIRKYRPDAVFSYDPGQNWMQWHKTDHRMAAFITLDGARAAAYHLYFPHHRIYEGLQPHTVTDFFFFESHEPNYKVDITDVADKKLKAFSQHVSQWGKQNNKYTGGEMDSESIEMIRSEYIKKEPDGKVYEEFRRVRESMSF